MATARLHHESQRSPSRQTRLIEQAAGSEAVETTDTALGLRIGWLGHKSLTIGDGLRSYSRNVTGELAARGAEVLFVHHEPALDDGCSSFSLRSTSTFQRRVAIARPGSTRRLEEILHAHPVDVVHVSAPFSTLDFALPRICHRLGLPLVVTFHVPFARNRSIWGALASGAYRAYASSLARCDRVIVLGPAQRDLLVRHGVPERAITILPNGVDIERYSPGPSGALRQFDAERLFTFFGRIDPEKQVEALVRAFLDAGPRHSTRLVVVGDGVELPRLRKRYRDPRVVFTGAILDERRRIEILRASDAFLLPSQVEAQSLALLEAMACGVAVASTPVGDHVEVLNGAGMILDPDRVGEDLRRCIVELEGSPELCRALGARARARAVDLFRLGAHVEGIVSSYRSLLSLRGAPRMELLN